MGLIYSNTTWNDLSKVQEKYLGTSYILSKKADFEPRKNI